VNLNIFAATVIIILFNWLILYLARKLRVPSVVGLIVAGLIIGYQKVSGILISGNPEFFIKLGDAGLICLMFVAGMESSGEKLLQEKKDAALIAISALALPVILGFFVFLALGFSYAASLIVGICAGITAEATKAKVLLELDKLNTRLGSALIGAGIIDDTIGLCLFVAISVMISGGGEKEELLALGSIFAFFVGLALRRAVGKGHSSLSFLKKSLNWTLVPFFFVSIGMHFELESLVLNPAVITLVMAVAFAGKLLGPFLIKPLCDFSWKQLYLVGWAMNSRGALGLALAFIAFSSGLIETGLYSSLVLTALVTTLIFPFVITWMVKRNPDIME